VKHVRGRARKARLFIGLGMLLSLLIAMTGCWWLINVEPIAAFTASVLFGEAPLTVNFSAVLSYDPDGDIVKYEWDFGDGTSGDGMSVSHTYTVAGTLTVVLKVTDDGGKTDTAQKTIVVSTPEEPGGAGPYATFTATPLTGDSPLTVTFNAAGSYHPIQGYTITSHTWDFGDGTTGAGVTTSHTYATAVTRTYHVVLTVIASDNTQGTAEMDVIVTVQGGDLPTGGPTASFTVNPQSGIAPVLVAFDPAQSTAAVGYNITNYFWNFGDQSSQSENSAAVVNHTYVTTQASQNFSVTLLVIDDHTPQSLYGSSTRNVVVQNRQPVAGFEIDPGTGFVADNVTIYNVPNNPPVAQAVDFQSVFPDWSNLTDPGLPAVPAPDRPNESSKRPLNYVDAHNLSYDPEGHWIDGDGWGIETYIWNFGDATAPVTVPANIADGSCPLTTHNYQLAQGEQYHTFTVILEVIDELGARGTYTRTVTLNSSPPPP
jgi:PKD repeat protein